jgi:acetyl-CoA carboxylase biotin carboxyl carrier protein
MDLTCDDVQDILKLLDGLPFGEMRLQTSRFTLMLRRADDGEWTQEMQVSYAPTVVAGTSPDGEGAEAGEGGLAGAGGAGRLGGGRPAGAGEAGGAEAAGTDAAAARTEAAAAGTDAAAAGTEAAAGDEGGAAAPGVHDGLVPVRAPLPGTFYRAPQPGAPPFVDVGSRVERDTVVGIVETMKLMNSVSAQATGTVTQIVVANAEPAQRDDVLMWIREDP